MVFNQGRDVGLTWPLPLTSSAPGSPYPVCASVSPSVEWHPHCQQLQMVLAIRAFTRYLARRTCSVTVSVVVFKTMTAKSWALIPLRAGLCVLSPRVSGLVSALALCSRGHAARPPEAGSRKPLDRLSGFLGQLVSRCFPLGCSDVAATW